MRTSNADSISAFIREAALESARSVMGRGAPPPARVAVQASDDAQIHYAYVGESAPGDACTPALGFASIRSFATNLSDRNRALLRWLGKNSPDSIHDLSNKFEYPYPSLSHNLRALEGLGLIGYDNVDQQSLRPYLRCNRLRLVLPFGAESGAGGRTFKLAVKSADDETVPPDVDLTLGSMEDFAAMLPDRGYALLQVIARHEPATIAALALLTGKSTQNTYTLVRHLVKPGLVKTEEAARHKRPLLAYDGLSLDITLRV